MNQTTREITLIGLGFTTEMSPWAGDYADDYDWDAIRDDYNARLKALAPEGVSWGWSESGPWCEASIDLDADEVRQAWTEAVGGTDADGETWESRIDFEAVATAREYPAIGDDAIRALRAEAGQAGDWVTVALTESALSNLAAARWEAADNEHDQLVDALDAVITDADEARAECKRVIREG